jgi:hypothetical protein
MEGRGPILGPASTRFNDYVGTVAADDAEALKDQPSLYELADIDRDFYTILAVDLRIDDPVTATVYAIDRLAHGLTPPELGDGADEIPVVQFNLPEPNVESLMRLAFRRISIRLVAQQFRDSVLVVSGPSSTDKTEA